MWVASKGISSFHSFFSNPKCTYIPEMKWRKQHWICGIQPIKKAVWVHYVWHPATQLKERQHSGSQNRPWEITDPPYPPTHTANVTMPFRYTHVFNCRCCCCCSSSSYFFLHPKRLTTILCSACALAGRHTSSSGDALIPSLRRYASKAGQRSHTWLYDFSSLSHKRHMVSSDRLIRFFQRRS